MTPPLAQTLDTDADFVFAVLDASGRTGALSWVEINRLAARWVRPETGDTSRRGHAVVLELSAHGLLDVELTTAADGAVMVRRATTGARAAVEARWALAA